MSTIQIIPNQHQNAIIKLFESDPDKVFQPELNAALAGFESCADALRSGATDAVVLPIQFIPPGGAADLSIAGLLTREKPGITIYYNAGSAPVNHLVKLNTDALIGCNNETILAQMRKILPDFRYQLIDSEPVRDDYDGVIYSSPEKADHAAEAFSDHFTFNPRELVPPTGMNIYALMCMKDEEEIREKLSKFNDQDVSRLSNIERRVLKSLMTEGYQGIHVYCEADTLQNYHLYAACLDRDNLLHTARLSSGLSSGMEDEILSLLQPYSI